MNFLIEGFLTEEKLSRFILFLQNYIPGKITILDKKDLIFGRFRCDMGFKYENENYIVEFDGSHHYSDINTIERDIRKDKILLENNFNIIRIPYFVQLTTETFKFYFPQITENVNITLNYPHGFIDKNALPPSGYCHLGEKRFIREIERLPEGVKLEIINSLKNKIAKEKRENSIEFIVSENIQYIL